MSSASAPVAGSPAIALPVVAWVRRVFSFPVTLAAALLFILFVQAVCQGGGHSPLADPDIWWHLANARTLLETHHFVRQDLFSFTLHGTPWIDIEWLPELPLYLAFRDFGARGVLLLMLALVGMISLGVYLLAWIRSRDVKAAFLAACVTSVLATVSLGPRTLLFGWVLLVVMLLVMELYRKGRDYTWALPVVFCVWINTHGSWLIGFVLWLVWVACGLVAGTWGAVESTPWSAAQRRKLFWVTAAILALLFVNPYGWRLVAYPFDFALHYPDIRQFIQEWATLDFHAFRGKLVLALLMGMGVLNLLRRRTWPLPELLFALIAVYSALCYSRFAFLAGVLLAPMLAVDLRGVLGKYRAEQDGIGRNAVSLLVLLLLAVWLMPSASALDKGMTAWLPESTLARVNDLPAGSRVFNDFDWGGYLIWTRPERGVFIDSRTDIFVRADMMNDYALATNSLNSLEILDKYRIDHVLMPHANPLTYLLLHTPGWTMESEDANAVLFRRAR